MSSKRKINDKESRGHRMRTRNYKEPENFDLSAIQLCLGISFSFLPTAYVIFGTVCKEWNSIYKTRKKETSRRWMLWAVVEIKASMLNYIVSCPKWRFSQSVAWGNLYKQAMRAKKVEIFIILDNLKNYHKECKKFRLIVEWIRCNDSFFSLNTLEMFHHAIKDERNDVVELLMEIRRYKIVTFQTLLLACSHNMRCVVEEITAYTTITDEDLIEAYTRTRYYYLKRQMDKRGISNCLY